jgi:hypothetical protein
MANKNSGSFQLCLEFLKNKGGRARLSELTCGRDIIQSLINSKLAKVRNTGAGFYLELEKKS